MNKVTVLANKNVLKSLNVFIQLRPPRLENVIFGILNLISGEFKKTINLPWIP